ncbi:MAG TPA: methyltransferase domain-containing protein [Verrucomicrobiae bacterium]|jgi:ubiquinone/menaquinone biosynthesis C-methylase UbiE|nr:methyltransferase domain-containing protein [Verrucomicrobiae bacterium]
MKRRIITKIWFLVAFCYVAEGTLAFTLHAKATAADEIPKLAALMEWNPGTVVADIGAGDGSYTFAAVEQVGPTGKVFATEIDEEKLKALRAEVKKRDFKNVAVVESGEAETNLPVSCCDAIFLRRVYHHLTKPVEFDRSLLRALKPGGKLAIIDFPPHPEYGKVKGVPKDREDHGIQQKILIDELTKAGFQLEKLVNDWPTTDYCVLFVKK